MKTNYLIILSFIVFFSCQKNNIVLQNVFSEEEMTEVDKLIQYYDNFINVQTGNKGEDLAHSYQTYLQVNSIFAQQGMDMNVLRPSLRAQIELFLSMNPDFIEKIYQKKAFEEHIGRNIEDSNPPLHINPNGKFIQFIQELAKVKPLFASCAKELTEKGDVGPQCYQTLLTLYPKIDFNNKDERFAFIVCMLRRE